MTFSYRSILVFLFDLLAASAAWVGAYMFRFNFDVPERYILQMLYGLALLLPAHALVCRWAGLYRGLWIFASLPDLKRVLHAVAGSGLILILFAAFYRESPVVPRTVVGLYPVFLTCIMAGGRVTYRMWKEHRLYGGLVGQGKPVVIIGAGTGGVMLFRELARTPDWRVVGFLDDDPLKWGSEILGCKILGPLSILPQVIEAEKARHVILAMPSAATEARKSAAELALAAGAHVFVVPGLEDLMSGRIEVSSLRRVEISDLLGREPVRIDTPQIETMLADTTILVTGAGGSIGSELCRQIVKYRPARILLLEQSEYALYQLEQWFSANAATTPIAALTGDVKDTARLTEIFGKYRPSIVFHAAAYKHVPLTEVGNAWQTVCNNVLGTLRVAQCAQRFSVGHFVLISTDKAVNPANVMGASKRLAEMVCQALQFAGGNTRFEMVRFGNVLGSTGSVIPKFQEQIANGGPVTVTHPEITRYFMSSSEAAQLVLQAASMGQGGEIFVLDMGEPVRIVDLARNMIRLTGNTEDEIHIEFTGLRPGEKLYEELLADSELTRETHHPKLRIASNRDVPAEFLNDLLPWLTQDAVVTDAEVRAGLKARIPEYTPSCSEVGQKNSASIIDIEPHLMRNRL